ncbi:MAG: hypothetical protein ACRC5H_00890 [Treponemataceae bacterium]
MKKIIYFLFFFCAAGAIFYFGYLQLHVPVNSYGVLISKTSGVLEKAIIRGEFLWRWEPLIPKNAQIRVFDHTPLKKSFDVEGELSYAKLYNAMLAQQNDFSYTFSFNTNISIKPQGLSTLIEKNTIANQEDLNAYLETMAEKLRNAVESSFLESFSKKENFIFSEFLEDIKNQPEYAMIDIQDAVFIINKMPNRDIYFFAYDAYQEYNQKTKEAIDKMTKEQSDISVDDFFKLSRYEQWGKILTEYPILIDFFAVSREDAAEVLNNLSAARAPSREKE